MEALKYKNDYVKHSAVGYLVKLKQYDLADFLFEEMISDLLKFWKQREEVDSKKPSLPSCLEFRLKQAYWGMLSSISMNDIVKALGMSDVSFRGKEYEERNKQFVQLIIDNGCMKTYVKLIKLLSDKQLDALALQLGNESPKPSGLFDSAISPKSPKKTEGFQLTALSSSLFGPPKKGFSFGRAEGF